MMLRLGAARYRAAAPFNSQAALGLQRAASRRVEHAAPRAAAAADDVVSEEAAQLLRMTKPKTVPTRRLTSEEVTTVAVW
jgi:hypothetical protein